MKHKETIHIVEYPVFNEIFAKKLTVLRVMKAMRQYAAA